MKVDIFDFELPDELIAKSQLEKRDSAKMLLVPSFENKQVCDLVDILPKKTLMVFNNTRVIPARIFAKFGGKEFEVMLHKNLGLYGWLAFIKNSRKLLVGDMLLFDKGLEAKVIEKNLDSGVHLEFNKSGVEFFNVLDDIGVMPLPPYIKREVLDTDKSSYQTVYAKVDGAVAAPTAGLHFTSSLLEKLKSRGVKMEYITLHVGAGTFQPVKVEDTVNHKMHSEFGIISNDVATRINDAKCDGYSIVAVGTTSLRLLESAVDKNGMIHEFEGETDIFITPPYSFKSVDYLMTNFHLPKSTLFMLVCAFAGMSEMKQAYEFVKLNGYRFYSYGDSSLLKKKD